MINLLSKLAGFKWYAIIATSALAVGFSSGYWLKTKITDSQQVKSLRAALSASEDAKTELIEELNKAVLDKNAIKTNTAKRIKRLQNALNKDSCGRVGATANDLELLHPDKSD